MLYKSTRGEKSLVSSAEAIIQGISPDGGLFIPSQSIYISKEKFGKMSNLTFKERALSILRLFLTDFTSEELKYCIDKAYSEEKFDSPEITPVIKLDKNLYVLELWHGPTCAFKDIALQILPHLLSRAINKTAESNKIAILVATSGDTGKAALEGFKNVPGIIIIVFYPEEGVSEIQKLQMVTQEGSNVKVVAVKGNFDQTQNKVKEILRDEEITKSLSLYHYRFSSANSINWGRLVPQIVYYFSAYLDLIKKVEIKINNRQDVCPTYEEINFVVPTGNFGNILAAFYAQKIGLPIHRLICATNCNNILVDFINTGIYNYNRVFHTTISPSMDILISSNLERLLSEITGHDSNQVNKWMKELKESGRYQVDNNTHLKIRNLFWSDFATDAQTLATIKHTYQYYNYLLDTHTAVGKYVYDRYVEATGDKRKTILVSTASPFKFNHSVARAILGEEAIKGKSEFELLKMLSEFSRLAIPPALRNLAEKPVLHNLTTTQENMKNLVREILTF